MQKRFLAFSNALLKLQFGRSSKFIPAKIRNGLKVYKYNLRLFHQIYTKNPSDTLFKQIRCFFQRRITILFYPDIPWENAIIYKICVQNGYRIVNNLHKPFDVAVKWKDSTVYGPDTALEKLGRYSQVINLRCNDIRKDHLELVFKEVFGYGSIVDPRKYQGKCVRKSILNARHDGVVFECPVEKIDEGFIYQVLIDNQVGENRVMDFRVPVFNGTIPFISIWYKTIVARFQGDFEENQYVPAAQVFSGEEQKKILRFCQTIGLDYGELDILKDCRDGRIYVIDANNTPTGETREAYDLDRQAYAFEDTFLNPKSKAGRRPQFSVGNDEAKEAFPFSKQVI